MPEEKFYNLHSVLKEIILVNKIEKSLDAAAKRAVLTEEEMDKLIYSW